MDPDRAHSHGEPAPRADLGDAGAVVNWYFGDIIDRVARDRPVSRPRLRTVLARIEEEVQSRESRLREVGERVECRSAPGIVLRLPGGWWRSLEQERGLTDREALAVRDVHRRMTASLAGGESPVEPGTDPLVLCARSTRDSP
jgi:hypothetical protein